MLPDDSLQLTYTFVVCELSGGMGRARYDVFAGSSEWFISFSKNVSMSFNDVYSSIQKHRLIHSFNANG